MDLENFNQYEFEGLKVFVPKFYKGRTDTIDISLKSLGPLKRLVVEGISY